MHLLKIKSLQSLSLIPWLALFISLPWLVHFLVTPYQSGWDESYQIAAAINLINGDGLTTLELINSETQNVYLYKWPPLYSFLLVPFLLIGLGVSTSSKIITVIFVFIGFYGWLKFAKSWIKAPILQLLAMILMMRSLSYFLLASETDYIIYSIFPFFLLNLHQIAFKPSITRKMLFSTAALLVFFISLKYSALSLIPATAITLVFFYHKKLELLVKHGFIILFPPSLIYLIITFVNKHFAATTTFVANQPYDYSFLYNLEFFKAALSKPIYNLFFSHIPVLGALTQQKNTLLIISTFFLIAFAIWLFKARYKSTEPSHKSLIILLIFSMSILGFFAGMTGKMMQNLPYDSFWFPLKEARYYLFLAPWILIIAISQLSKIATHKAAVLTVIVIGLYSFIGVANLSKNRNNNVQREAIEALSALDPEAGVILYSDTEFFARLQSYYSKTVWFKGGYDEFTLLKEKGVISNDALFVTNHRTNTPTKSIQVKTEHLIFVQ